MDKRLAKKIILYFSFLLTLIIPLISFSTVNTNRSNTMQPMVAQDLFEKAKANENWKVAFATAKNGQVVFMDVSPSTNPKNEVGMESHPFDQFILVAEGKGKAVFNGKEMMFKTGDLIFIPQGTNHNIINLNSNQPLKIISFYSDRDIPANAVYKKKSDEPAHE